MATLVNPKALAAAAHCASTDPARPQLRSVFIDGAGWTVGTDGHVLLEVSPLDAGATALQEYPIVDGGLGEHFNGEGLIVPAANAIAGARMAPKKTHIPLLRNVVAIAREKGNGELFATDLDSRKVERFRAIEGPFPNWRQCFPVKPAKAYVGLNVDVLLQLATALHKAGVEQVRMEVREPLHALTFAGMNGEGQAVRALLMPLRLPEDKA